MLLRFPSRAGERRARLSAEGCRRGGRSAPRGLGRTIRPSFGTPARICPPLARDRAYGRARRSQPRPVLLVASASRLAWRRRRAAVCSRRAGGREAFGSRRTAASSSAPRATQAALALVIASARNTRSAPGSSTAHNSVGGGAASATASDSPAASYWATAARARVPATAATSSPTMCSASAWDTACKPLRRAGPTSPCSVTPIAASVSAASSRSASARLLRSSPTRGRSSASAPRRDTAAISAALAGGTRFPRTRSCSCIPSSPNLRPALGSRRCQTTALALSASAALHRAPRPRPPVGIVPRTRSISVRSTTCRVAPAYANSSCSSEQARARVLLAAARLQQAASCASQVSDERSEIASGCSRPARRNRRGATGRSGSIEAN